jgi:cell wall-associated NlpC family hydrolase
MRTESRRIMATAPAPRRSAARRAGLALAAVVGILFAGVPAQAAPGDPSTSAEAAEVVAAKGHELEVVTEQFNEARETLKQQHAAAEAAIAEAEQAQAELAVAQQGVVGVARTAYTGETMSSFRALLTSDSAEEFVGLVSTLDMVADHQNELLDAAATASVAAAQAQAAAQELAAEAQAQFDAVAAQQAALEGQIAEYQAVFDRLSAAEQQAAIDAHHPDDRASRDDRSEPVVSSGLIVANSAAAQIAVDTAMAQQGKPYVWAASGPGSYDCSGLVQFAYAAAGIGLPHSSRMQSQMGQQVSRDQLQPGDLVFFYSPVSHVGIYIGNGQMVHAPTSGDVVKVASIDAMGSYSHATRIAG